MRKKTTKSNTKQTKKYINKTNHLLPLPTATTKKLRPNFCHYKSTHYQQNLYHASINQNINTTQKQLTSVESGDVYNTNKYV